MVIEKEIESKAILFFREYSGHLNDWQRKTYSTGKILNVALLKLFDILQSGIFNGGVKRISQNDYKVNNQIYSYLRSEGYIEIAKERDIKIDVLK